MSLMLPPRALEPEIKPIFEQIQAALRHARAKPQSVALHDSCRCQSESAARLRPGLPLHVQEAVETDARPLDGPMRRRFERLFGVNLKDVRIIVGERASQSAAALGVPAYTVAKRIVFGAGEFNPCAPRGHWLIAHELVHVLQQSQGPIEAPQTILHTLAQERQANMIADGLLREPWSSMRIPGGRLLRAQPASLQGQNPVLVKCKAICPVEVFLDPRSGAPCGLVDCGRTSTPGPRATSWCAYQCALQRYGAFIINTVCGPVGPYFTDQFVN
jgi:hypothetical protein